MTDSESISPDQFGEFYKELYPERTPYRWHERAARELVDGRAWKDARIWEALSAPTGAGKTALIECFLFALACTEGQPSFPRRLFWVVDRRNVVDQVFEHALGVAQLITDAPKGGLLSTVRARLERLADGTKADGPVQVRLWRGGLTGEPPMTSKQGDGGMRAPLSPVAAAVVCSTIDQVGSRLLFRGYGISRRSRPIEAALVGTDSLIVLDEAHLSGAFQATARAIADMQRDTPLHRPRVQVMAVTATQAQPDPEHMAASKTHAEPAPEHVFELTDAEREDPALARRQAAKRPVTLIPARNPALACVKAARVWAEEGRRVIGVVANTVGSARQIAKALRPHGQMVLIIGPARPLDRERLLDQIPKRNERTQLERPLFVVGTQTLEVGLDLDFDALVSECAPLPSLVQRFGRLDRAGDLTAANKPGCGAVVQPPKPCPVYEEATASAWRYLCERAKTSPLQFGAADVANLVSGAPPGAREISSPRPPKLLSLHVELFAQTSQDPVPNPYVAAFLRGERAHEPTDVQICWRADLTEETQASWTERVEARLPHPGELLSLSPRAARRWLSHREARDGLEDVGDLADVEGISAETDEPPPSSEPPTFVRVPSPDLDGDVKPEHISLSELRPGNVIVLPAIWGGCDEYGFDPSSHRPVNDLGNLSRSRPRLLLSPQIGTPSDLLDAASQTLQMMAREEISEEEAYRQLRDPTVEWLASAGSATSQTPAERVQRQLASTLSQAGKAIRLAGGDEATSTDIVLVPRRDRTQDLGAAVPYRTHAKKVEERVGAFAARLDLPDALTETLKVAARHHDLGKLDRRFQAWLNGGSTADPNLTFAKSERGPGTPRSWVARKESGWPRSKRHEAVSAALLDKVECWPQEVDRELLLYLVSTHHGDGRPFRRHVQDSEPVLVNAQIGGETVSVWSDAEIPWAEHADRFVALNERFGAWGLAAIESLLVLADRGVSAEGS
jgi:CRISPR-associated endonuclease/helicase Cas3